MTDAEVRSYFRSMLDKPGAPADPKTVQSPNPASAPVAQPGADPGFIGAEKLGLNPKKLSVIRVADSGGECLVLTIRKMLDLEEGQYLVQAVQSVASEKPRKCVIDLADLDFCDSLLLGFCLMAYQVTKRLGGNITFQMRQTSFVHQSFEIAKLFQILPVELI